MSNVNQEINKKSADESTTSLNCDTKSVPETVSSKDNILSCSNRAGSSTESTISKKKGVGKYGLIFSDLFRKPTISLIIAISVVKRETIVSQDRVDSLLRRKRKRKRSPILRVNTFLIYIPLRNQSVRRKKKMKVLKLCKMNMCCKSYFLKLVRFLIFLFS